TSTVKPRLLYLLEGLTREILRDQPEDIPKYAAQYFETLLKKREGNYNFLSFNEMKWEISCLKCQVLTLLNIVNLSTYCCDFGLCE
uniref:RIIa domain-containing protein n=1 Tax=Amphilophus citrinellus TaxID=61819 RepID=A0A3Q0QS94_AMPCI